MRIKNGGLDALAEEERKVYEQQMAFEKEQLEIQDKIKELIHSDVRDIDGTKFEEAQNDQTLLEEWSKQVVDNFFADQKDSDLVQKVPEMLSKAPSK